MAGATNRKVLVIFTGDEPVPEHRDSDGAELLVAPRCKTELDEADRRKLFSQGIRLPEHSCSDLDIIRSRISLDPSLQMWNAEASCDSRPNSRVKVLKQVKQILNRNPGGSYLVCIRIRILALGAMHARTHAC